MALQAQAADRAQGSVAGREGGISGGGAADQLCVEVRVSRATPVDGEAVWGDESLPKPTWPRRVEWGADGHTMRADARLEQDVWEECEHSVVVFKEGVKGVTGARAFFDAIAPTPSAASASSAAPRGVNKRPRAA